MKLAIYTQGRDLPRLFRLRRPALSALLAVGLLALLLWSGLGAMALGGRLQARSLGRERLSARLEQSHRQAAELEQRLRRPRENPQRPEQQPAALLAELSRRLDPDTLAVLHPLRLSEAVAPAGGYVVQLAAFRERSQAESLVQRLSRATARAVEVELVELADGAWYRVRSAGFESRNAARAWGEELARQGLIQEYRLQRAGVPLAPEER